MASEWKAIVCAVLVGLSLACLKPAEVTKCGDFTCGIGSICSPDGTRCIAPETVYACNDLADGDRCTYTGVPNGACQGGICVAGGCGNGVVEAALGEVCDDGNLVSLDGCRGDCKSTETCGDGIQDLAKLEYCDCGMPGSASTVPPCDGPNSNEPGAVCRTDCKLARCGDGVPDPGELCDDGNNVAGDGCRADCAGRFTAMQSNTLATLTAVWATSSTDAWAVGVGRILHWDGSMWTRITEPAGPSRSYSAVCGVSPTEVFVVGEGKAFRYQGTAPSGSWAPVATTDNYAWMTVHCRGTQAWLGGTFEGGGTNTYVGYGFWTGSSFSVGNVSTSNGVKELWSSSDGVLWAINFGNALLKVSSDYVYWTQETSPAEHVSGTTSTDVTFTTSTAAMHLDTVVLPIADSDELPNASAVRSVPGASPSQTLIVGPGGGLLVCTATTCKAVSTNSSANLTGIYPLDEKHAFIVGTNGTILY